MNEERTMLDITERLESIADWGGTTNVVAICRDAKTEINRIRAENADLAGMLKLYFHAHETGNSLPPYIVTQARAILAKTASHQPADDQEEKKSS